MKYLLLAGIAVASLHSAALAADLGVMPLKAPAMAAPAGFNWSGFYIGGHIGWGWEAHSTDSYLSSGAFEGTTNFNDNGFFGGGQIGYNWVFSSNWLLGIEFDGSPTAINTNVTGCSTTGCANSSISTDAFGTGRGRLGYVLNNMLFYGTGGWAWSDSHTDRTVTCISGTTAATACPGGSITSALTGQTSSASGWQSGWSAGGGIEWAFAPRLTAKVEYMHLQLDNITRSFSYPGFAAATRTNVGSDSIDTVKLGVNFLFAQ